MTVNLLTGEQYAPRPDDYHTKCTAVAPGGDCPLWREFLTTVTAGDQALADYLQRVAGYCLSGYTREHALFFCHGAGANGKSVFVNTLTGVMGDYAMAAPMETFVESRGERHPTDLAMLRGARLVVATETEAGRRWNEARIKALTGGDPIAARFMRGDFFEFTPTFKLIVMGNHKPSLRNVDEAIRRRLHLIPFNVTIPPGQRDPRLADKLKQEWPGILQWMVDGCAEWRRVGLNPPKAVTAATDAYLAAEDTIGLWLDECTEAANNSEWVRSGDLFASWKACAERAGEPAGTQKRFSQALVARGYEPKRQPGTGRQGFVAIRMKRVD